MQSRIPDGMMEGKTPTPNTITLDDEASGKWLSEKSRIGEIAVSQQQRQQHKQARLKTWCMCLVCLLTS